MKSFSELRAFVEAHQEVSADYKITASGKKVPAQRKQVKDEDDVNGDGVVDEKDKENVKEDLDEVDENYVSHAQRKAVWATRKDGGKGHPDNKKKVKESLEVCEAMDQEQTRLLQLARLGLVDKADIGKFRLALAMMKTDKTLSMQQRTLLLNLLNDLLSIVTGDDQLFMRLRRDVQKEETQQIEEAVSVKKQDYSWGKMVTVHHGNETSYPLHPEHQSAIKNLKDGEHTSFKDETNRKVTAHREGDNVHLSGAGTNKKTTVAHSHFTEARLPVTHEDPLVTVHDKDGLHTHANLSVANHIFQTKVKHTAVHKGPVKVKSGGSYGNVTFAISQHHAKDVVKESGDVPFDGPYKKAGPDVVVDKSGAKHTSFSRAKDLARKAIAAAEKNKAQKKK